MLLLASFLMTSGTALAVPVPPLNIPGSLPQIELAQSSADIAQQSMRIDALENNMRNLTGKIDELTYQMQQIQELLKRMQEDNEFRFRELEGGKKHSQAEPVPAEPMAEPVITGAAEEPAVTDMEEQPADLSQGFSIDQTTDPTQSAVTDDGSVSDQILGTLPDDGTIAGGAGPLDLSALARGDQPVDTASLDSVPGVDSADPIGDLSAPKSALPSVGATMPAVGTQVADIVAPTDPRVVYEQGYNYILAGNYARAEASFKQFLADYPDNKRASDATFWLGESYFARKQFRDAADSFLTTYRDYPRSAKAPDSLLKLGLSLEGLGQKDAACATYGELERKYPNASPALITQLTQKKTDAGC